MQVQLYVMTSDSRYVDKNKTLLADTDCTFKQPIDVENPVIIIKGNDADKCNYFYIPHFNRYYFVTQCVGMNSDLTELHGNSDVLSSVNVKGLTATVERQEFKRNTKLVDNELIAQANNNFICRQVGNPVNLKYNIYITTCGGGVLNGGA